MDQRVGCEAGAEVGPREHVHAPTHVVGHGGQPEYLGGGESPHHADGAVDDVGGELASGERIEGLRRERALGDAGDDRLESGHHRVEAVERDGRRTLIATVNEAS